MPSPPHPLPDIRCLVFAAFMLAPGMAVAEERVLFETHVAPILDARCVECHSPQKRKGELDLTTAAGILRGGESGPVFAAGDPKHSHLLEMVQRGEMPKKGEKLGKSQVSAIRAWILAGAGFENPPKPVEAALNQHDVLPITHLRCVTCHGARRKDGGLDLRTVSAMREGGNSGPALIAGKPGESRMIQRIESEDCPPGELLLKYFVKRPPDSEVAKLRSWIAAGAPEAKIEPDIATNAPDPLVSGEDRQHWAFQPPKAAPNGSIDHFIGRKLAENGLTWSPEASREALIRRAYFDLTGLPPSIAEWRRWRESEAADWFETMVDHLLASPRYGERWGRYWLDLAGYADSEGGISADPMREVAWKYRDYVIKAFNADKPYDRFLLEQIAGDELVAHRNAPEITPEIVDNLVATGFLRMGIDQTGSRTMNFVPERLGVIGDAIEVLGSGVLGLTLECVKCHSHKYDPIPQRDYYRLKAIFQGAYDEHDWLSFKTRSLKLGTPDHRRQVAAVNPPLEKELKKLEAERKAALNDWREEILRRHAPELSAAERKETIAAVRVADNTRTLRQRRSVEKLQSAELRFGDSTRVAEIEAKIARVRGKMAPPLAIRALWDRGEPSPTYILRRGEHDKPGRLVGPGVPSVLTDGRTPFVVNPPFSGKTGRRLAFARWLTGPDHPLTARVMANRIWRHHFGEGLVQTVENFGVQGAKPSHPQLLDWLAVEFVRRGWSMKQMHRLMMTSRAYKQSSRVSDARFAADPENRLLSRMRLRRLDAEALRDSLLFVAGKLKTTPGGPPDRISVDRDGLVRAMPAVGGGWRRSVYLQFRRTEIPTMMDTFDYPEMGPNCVSRSISTVSPQSLLLMNDEHVRELARAMALRVGSMSGSKVDAAYQLALSRNPTAQERNLGESALLEMSRDSSPKTALEAYCHTLLNSAAFLYVD